MLRVFREANGLTSTQYDVLFASASDLPSRVFTAKDTIVFVDDFSGTGNQVVRTWPTLQELIASEARCFLILTAATSKAVKRISKDTELKPIVYHELNAKDDVFDKTCTHFDTGEKGVIEFYCKKASRRDPRGYGKCGILLVLSHKTPNNSIPILHANSSRWKGLFPRKLQGTAA
jgi:hypothetical protein